MTSIHETAYPRFKPDLTQRELEEIYTPTESELRFGRRHGRTSASRLYLMILLKTVQRLGYFPMLAEVPNAITAFVTKALGLSLVQTRALAAEEKSQARRIFIDAIRTHQKIKPVTQDTNLAIEQAATQAAQTKQELADIINVVIEELVRQRFELPAFSRLNRTAQRIRNQVNERYFRTLFDPLPGAVIKQFDAMLMLSSGQLVSGWQQLKQDPKKPTNTEVRQYLEHVKWLKSWSSELPQVAHIPAVKRASTCTRLAPWMPQT